jgi:hypothetical protein
MKRINTFFKELSDKVYAALDFVQSIPSLTLNSAVNSQFFKGQQLKSG